MEQIWELWTTKRGIESWWGPDGFSVKVHRIDLRVGGELSYTMTATAPAQMEFLEQAGMPLATSARMTYTEVEPLRRLSYTSRTDFIPHVEPYEVTTTVSFDPASDGNGVHVQLSFDAFHDEVWTERATLGHEAELARLEALVGQLERTGGDAGGMARGKPSPAVLAAIAVGHVVVTSLIWRDIRHRSEDQIRGSKRAWRLATAANTGNSVAYLMFGRRRAPSARSLRTAPPTTAK
jgi:uncharacterized protein YndB with AHSA1/START domain